jgi:hypothetical protein
MGRKCGCTHGEIRNVYNMGDLDVNSRTICGYGLNSAGSGLGPVSIVMNSRMYELLNK